MAATSDLVVLLDGATARTETGCRHGPAWYTRKLGANIVAEAANHSWSLQYVLAKAISGVAALHPECDLSHPGTPSAAAAVVRIEGDVLRYVALGDVTIAIETTDGIQIVSDQRVSKTARRERAEADKYLIGSQEKASALVRMKHAELAMKNREDGYWIAAADPDAVRHALLGSVPLATLSGLAVLSDGAARIVDAFNLISWREAMEVMSVDGGPAELVKRVRAIEENDCLGARFPRNKKSDDATAVYAATGVGAAIQHQHQGVAMPKSMGSAESKALIQELLREFQNNPRIIGGDTPFRDAAGKPCRAEESVHWQRLSGERWPMMPGDSPSS